MAINTISLTSGMRSNLISLQQTSVLMDRTQTRLSTGKKVNTSLDDPINYFKALANTNRAADLQAKKDGMSEAIQTVKAASTGIDAITDLLQQAKSIVDSSRTATNTGILATQFNQILSQIANLAEDSKYSGTNLLGGNNLKVDFNEDGTNSLTICGVTATGVGTIDGKTVSAADSSWGTAAYLDTATGQIDSAISQLRADSQTLASNLAIITSRQSFTDNMVATLKTGADNLTLADMNEEGANMLMLQTRQDLGTTALSLSSQAAQSVLRLF